MPELKSIVVLLHGLLRSRFSMRPVARHLQRCGYNTLCVGYPSRKAKIPELVRFFLAPLLDDLRRREVGTIHFVTHSMGGILLRCYLAETPLPELGRVVMIAPPNRGSELVDYFERFYWFRTLFGPAACQLTTAANALPSQLGPFPEGYASDCLGIVTGDSPSLPCWNLFFHGPSDGRVSVASAQLSGMADLLILPYGHSFIMYRSETKRQIAFFLKHGHFLRQDIRA